MFQMDALDSMPDVSYDLIPEHITALLFICHIPEFTHFIMQMSPDWYEGFVQFQTGGNFVCLCESKRQKIRLAHILGTQNIFGFKMVASKWPFIQIFVQTKQTIQLPKFSIRDFTKNPIGRPPVGPPSLVSLAAAAILAAGGSKRTVKSFRSGLAKKAYCMNKADLFLIDDQGLDCISCATKWHTWSCIQNNKNIV